MSKYAKRVDSNHAEIRDYFREFGAKVKDTSFFGHGFPDLLVRWAGKTYYVEIKQSNKSKLTKPEKEFREFLGGTNFHVVTNKNDVNKLLGVKE